MEVKLPLSQEMSETLKMFKRCTPQIGGIFKNTTHTYSICFVVELTICLETETIQLTAHLLLPKCDNKHAFLACATFSVLIF